MTDPKTEKPDPSLRDHPEIATEIACFIGNFNVLEALLHLLFAQMIGDSICIAHAVLSPWNSFAQKLDVIINVAKLISGNPQAKAILDNEQRLRDINTFRNLLAHSAYSIEEGKVSAVSYLVSSRKPKSTPIDMKVIDDKCTILKTVVDAFREAVKTSTGEDRNAYIRSLS